jgi:hypothetical protein
MENKEFFSLFPEFRYEVFEEKIEKPLELNLHANSDVSMIALNNGITNGIEKSKLREASFVKHDIFSSPALVEKICSDNILSPYVMFLLMMICLKNMLCEIAEPRELGAGYCSGGVATSPGGGEASPSGGGEEVPGRSRTQQGSTHPRRLVACFSVAR